MAQPDITIPDIGLRARERVDMVNSSFISATEEESLVETAWKEFVLRLAERHDDVLLDRRVENTVANDEFLALHQFAPRNILKFRAVQYYDNNQAGEFLRRLDVREEMQVSSGRTGKPTHYMVHLFGDGGGPQLRLFPSPDRVYRLRVFYVPFGSLRDMLASGGNLFTLACWDEYLVVSVAIKMKDKEEGDCSVLLAEKDQLFELMMKSIAPFDEGEPAAVVQQRTGLPNVYDLDPFLLEDRLGYG